MKKIRRCTDKIIKQFLKYTSNEYIRKLRLLRKWTWLKSDLHIQAHIPKISEKDIWWASFGENIGVEINGKSNLYSRPILIFKKLSKYSFLGIPITSQRKTGSWYIQFSFRKKKSTAVLSQAKVMSVYRLYNRMGTLDNNDYNRIKEGFRSLYL